MDVYHRTSAPRLWHYTNNSACVDILRSGCIWASDIRYLNDALEYSYASQFAADFFKRQKNSRLAAALAERFPIGGLGSTDSTFVFSMSALRDDLGQWRAYCPTGGVALGIEPRRLQYFAGDRGRLIRCAYDTDAQSSILSDVFRGAQTFWERTHDDELAVEEFMRLFGDRLPEFKHPSFRAEEEFRLVIRPAPTEELCHSDVSVRAGRTMLVRYMKLSFRNPNAMLWLIPELVTAPAPYPELAEQAAYTALCPLFPFNDVLDVRSSESSYRNWI